VYHESSADVVFPLILPVADCVPGLAFDARDCRRDAVGDAANGDERSGNGTDILCWFIFDVVDSGDLDGEERGEVVGDERELRDEPADLEGDVAGKYVFMWECGRSLLSLSAFEDEGGEDDGPDMRSMLCGLCLEGVW